ncbi:class I SAM-dependent methyltransferase [Saccharothrix sp. S26]|uniref:class I SAM-dependent methyltransferase n=1 Tax=Saccharothrix sp. S26 TaxID=2907215 RepID=UPI001F20317C|nr:class I SAM-dependent methyltransferase [Saccharothrix sp. S26]MCE6997390.1 class I SAM-dependent methyltransferase [Saccharothrix sp. S26]
MSDHPSTTSFDRARSASYDGRAAWLPGGLYRRVAEDVAALAGPGAGGCCNELASRRADLVLQGVDLSAHMTAIAGLRASSIAFHVADVVALPRSDAGVDVVVLTLSMHEWPDRRRAVAELRRCAAGARLRASNARCFPGSPGFVACPCARSGGRWRCSPA